MLEGWKSRVLVFGVMVLCATQWMGAGCSDWNVEIDGEAVLDGSVVASSAGVELRMLVMDERDGCTSVQESCVSRVETWPLSLSGSQGRKTFVEAGVSRYAFSLLWDTDVDYRARVFVFVDGNGDQVYSPGEAYGELVGGPLTRENEGELLPAEIEVGL